MTHAYTVDAAILRHLDEQGSSTIEELFRSLSRFTLNQLLFAIDRLSREGTIILQRPTRFDYLVSATASGARAQINPQPIGRKNHAREWSVDRSI